MGQGVTTASVDDMDLEELAVTNSGYAIAMDGDDVSVAGAIEAQPDDIGQ